MLDSHSKYHYVKGDIDKVIIDGGVMPRRSDDQKKILRGEDICFLLEATRRFRNNWASMLYHGAGGSSSKVTNPDFDESKIEFTRSVSRRQLNKVFDCIHDLYAANAVEYAAPEFLALAKMPTAKNNVQLKDGYSTFMTLHSSDVLRHSDLSERSKNPHALLKSDVQSCFDDLKRIACVCHSFGTYSYDIETKNPVVKGMEYTPVAYEWGYRCYCAETTAWSAVGIPSTFNGTICEYDIDPFHVSRWKVFASVNTWFKKVVDGQSETGSNHHLVDVTNYTYELFGGRFMIRWPTSGVGFVYSMASLAGQSPPPANPTGDPFKYLDYEFQVSINAIHVCMNVPQDVAWW